MAQLVEALRYKSEGRGFDSRLCHWIFWGYTQPLTEMSTRNLFYWFLLHTWGHAVAQLVEALRYKSEDCGFDSRLCHWIFWGYTQPLTEMSTGNLFYFIGSYYIRGGTRWRSWLKHCATSRKVAGSIPDCVIGFFWGYTQPLTEMSTRNLFYFYFIQTNSCTFSKTHSHSHLKL